MKKLLLPFLAVVLFWAASCNKDIKDPVVTPADNSWIVNNTTFTSAGTAFYDTAITLVGISPKPNLGILKIHFFRKPTESGSYVFRQVADEPNEVSIEIVDSVNKVIYHSQDNDGKALKTEQFATVDVSGSKVNVSFIDAFLKQDGTEDWAKISVVAKQSN
ncbi:hypothetical protein [Rurimicrobium arvi]|uniref:Lipoprotein n=1 Tax=Rurimicrobium arvi TaxID=2049916 RepID=A0ABP8MLY5_9BACT